MPRASFQYWDESESEWVEAQTPKDGNALINYSYTEKMGNPAEVDVILADRSADGFAQGAIAQALTDFQLVRIIDGSLKMIIFYGRIYDSDQNYDMQYGPTVRIKARDMLGELADIELSDVHNTAILYGKSLGMTIM